MGEGKPKVIKNTFHLSFTFMGFLNLTQLSFILIILSTFFKQFKLFPQWQPNQINSQTLKSV